MRNTLKSFESITQDLLDDESIHPVAKFTNSEELSELLDLSLNENPISEEEFEKSLRELIQRTPRTATNAFFNQLFGGRNDKAILGDLLAVILNNSMYTYKAAGPQVGVEKVILREICNMIGWNEESDGTFATGGSMTNYMSMVMARDRFNTSIRTQGMKERLTVYTSEESHYSIPKNAAFSGIGRDQVRYVKSDHLGRMNTAHLAELIELDLNEGYSPIMVNITAGTTVLGAFDPIISTREICDKYDLWLHIDGAYCGSVLFSENYKHLIEGVHLADSFSFNAHKMLGTPLTCSIIVTKNKKHLHDSFSNNANYLYQTDHDEFNLGKTSLQCGRRNDALKFWTLWKSVGTKGLAQIVEQQFMLADTARTYIRSNSDYKLYSFDSSISICFNYKDVPAREICTALYEESKLLVGYGVFNNQEFIRLVTINAQNDPEDIINFFKVLENFVDDYLYQNKKELHISNQG